MARPSVSASRTAWRRLAERVKARAAELDLTLEQLAASDGPSRSSWSKLMNAAQTSNKMDPAILRAASVALGWTPQSLRLLLEQGTEPEEAEGARRTVEGRLTDLEARVGRLETEGLAPLSERLEALAAERASALERLAAPPPPRRSRQA